MLTKLILPHSIMMPSFTSQDLIVIFSKTVFFNIDYTYIYIYLKAIDFFFFLRKIIPKIILASVWDSMGS